MEFQYEGSKCKSRNKEDFYHIWTVLESRISISADNLSYRIRILAQYLAQLVLQ